MPNDSKTSHDPTVWLEEAIERTEIKIKVLGGTISRLELLDRFEEGVIRDMEKACRKAGVSNDAKDGQLALIRGAIQKLRRKASN